MKFSRLVVLSAASSVILLSACTKKPDSSPGYQNTPGVDNSSAQSYGDDNSQAYAQGKGADGRDINSLKAPSNQTYYFDFNSNNVDSSDYKALNIQANYIAGHPKAKVRLEGNTDNRGSREYNVGLGWRRDQSVARLLEQQGVRPAQIDMVSYGKERPVALGDNEHDWQLNRRVNLVYEAY